MLKRSEALALKCSVKKRLLNFFAIFTGKHPYQSLFFNKVEACKKRETLAQEVFREFSRFSWSIGKQLLLKDNQIL